MLISISADEKDKYSMTEVEGGIAVQNRNVDDTISDLSAFELECRASKQLYREPSWKFRVNHRTFQLIDKEKGATIKNNDTNLTYWSTLAINPPFLVNRTGDYNYMCITVDNEGRKRAEITSIHVNASQEPSIDKRVQRNKHIPPGSAYETLVCEAGGFPAPSIRWYKVETDKVRYSIDDVDIYDFGEGRRYLRFINATETIKGEYICVASNIKGNDTLNYTVTLSSGEKVPLSRTTLLIGIFVFVGVIAAAIFVMIYVMRKLINQLFHNELLSPHTSVPGEWSEALPLNPRWEFPLEKLKLGDVLGQGAFGVVRISEAIGIKANEDRTIVAVKQPKHKNKEAVTALVKELKIMDHIGANVNITNLLGACTTHLAQWDLYVIIEYCKYGSLDDFLKSHREHFIDEVNQDTGNLESHPGDTSVGLSVGVSRPNSIYMAGSSGYSIGNLKSHPGDNSVGLSVGVSRPNSIYMGGNLGCSTGEPVQSVTTHHSPSVTEDGHLATCSSSPPNAKDDLEQATQKTMSTNDLLCWGYQIANGMDYLGHRNIVHCDLATRNVLLAEGNVVKLCDFGLAKYLGIYLERYPDRPPVRKGNERLPFKWMSIEAIEDLTFSIQSDVWSYGVVLWEMFTLGRTPYPGINARDILDYLKNGNRLPKPEYATREVYNLMKECWNEAPMLRPSFRECSERLGSSLEEGVKQHYSQLNDYYLELNKDLDQDRRLEGLLEPTYENLMARGRAYSNEEEISTGGPTVDTGEKYQN